ncbi:MAG: hypothetical protein KC561_06845, partial [Myxococcales bacterium]|nr:hypothetical protein [Myxococcales bacterium]
VLAYDQDEDEWTTLGEDLGLMTTDGQECVERPQLPSDVPGDCPTGTWPVTYRGFRRTEGNTRGARLLATEQGHNGALQTSFLHVRFLRQSEEGTHWVTARLLVDPIAEEEE